MIKLKDTVTWFSLWLTFERIDCISTLLLGNKTVVFAGVELVAACFSLKLKTVK